MEDTLQSGLRQDQWFSSRATSEKLLEKRSNSLGSGALHFIRTRSSIRRELKRHCNQSKSSESTSSNNEGGNGGGGVGGLGKWLREHLGGGSRGSHDVSIPLPAKRTGSADKSLTRVTYASQNLYCSLPREHGRHCHNIRKHIQPGLHSRPRSNSANFHEKSHSDSPHAPFIGTITRGGPIYGSEGKTIKRRNRDRRRHSLNETQDGGQNHRKSKMDTLSEDILVIGNNVSPNAGDLDDISEPSLGVLVMDGISEQENDSTKKFATSKMSSVRKEENGQYEKDDKNEDESENIERFGTELDKIEEDDEEVTPYEEGEESVEDEEEENEDEYVASKLSGTNEIIDTQSFFIINEISSEVFRDRRAMIDKIKEVISEKMELRRKNRLLEYWVVKNTWKATERIGILNQPEKQEVPDSHYKNVLLDYKKQLDMVLRRKNELANDISYHNDKYKESLLRDYEVFVELINQERSTGAGLIFSKTGRQLTDKALQNLIYRQLGQRERLSALRLKYILKQHRYEGIKLRIEQADNLGPDKTGMKYEELCLQQLTYRQRIDERDHETEKIRNRMLRFANMIAHYKETSSFYDMDVKKMKYKLFKVSVETKISRQIFNEVHSKLAKVRSQYEEKRHEAGFLIAQPVLLEMERAMKILEELREDIEVLKINIHHLQRTERNKATSEKSVMTPVPKYKIASKPGRS